MNRFHFKSDPNECRQADTAHNPILQSHHSKVQKCNICVLWQSTYKSYCTLWQKIW